MLDALADASLGDEGGGGGEVVAGDEDVACAVVTPFKVDGDADCLLLDEPGAWGLGELPDGMGGDDAYE